MLGAVLQFITVYNDHKVAMDESKEKDSATLEAVPCTLAIIPPCPPAQPFPQLCWLLHQQRCPLYEPTYQLKGLPQDASSHSAPGPPAS